MRATRRTRCALQSAMAAFDLPQVQFLQIIDGHERDLRQVAYPSFAELDIYCQHVAGTLQQLTAKICGFQQPETLDYARKLGVCPRIGVVSRESHFESIFSAI